MLVIEEGGLWPDMQFYRFAHDLDFTQMLGAEGTYLGSFGTLVVSRQPDRLNLWLGLREKTLIGWDGGWIVAELRQRPDSLYGKWSRTCRGCRGNGRIVFRRDGP